MSKVKFISTCVVSLLATGLFILSGTGAAFAASGDNDSDIYCDSAADCSTADFYVIPFVDVDSSNEHHEAITWVYENGIATGWNDGTYRPLNDVNRDAMASFLYRMAGMPPYKAPEVSPFSDLKPTDQFFTEIMWAYENGITTGWDMGDGTKEFRPTEPIARDAMAAFMYRFAGEPDFENTDVKAFSDVSNENKFAKEISWMRSTGLTTGWDDNTFRPNTYVKRDAMAAFLQRYDNEFME